MSNVIPIDTAKLKSKKDYALAYAAIGWQVLPLWYIDKHGKCACGKCASDSNSRGKHPVTARGQNEATTDPAIISAWWGKNPNYNIGIYLAGSNLVAVDIDPRNGGLYTLEALEAKHGKIESDVLQFTGGDGQHRVFALPKSITNLPGSLGAGVDLKLNGYIVVEPSNHYNGGTYSWEGSSNPLDGIAPSPLPDWIRGLAAPSQKSKPNAANESRLTTKGQVEELRDALKFIDADDRDTWIRVGLALKTIGAVGFDLWQGYSQQSEKYNDKDQFKRWQGLEPHDINIETIFFMARQNGWQGIQPEPFDVSGLLCGQRATKDHIVAFNTNPSVGPILDKLPGILGDIEDYFNATAYIPQPEFAQQTAWGVGSTMLGRRFTSTYDHYSSAYFALIGQSACGKEHAKTIATNIFYACEKDLLAGDGYTSPGGIISALKERPCHLSIIDEFGYYLEAANNPKNINGREANSLLMQCITRCKSEIKSKNYSNKGASNKTVSDTIIRPAISIIGMTTPETFYRNLTMETIADGFFGRFLYVNSKMPRVAARLVKPTPVPKSIISWSKALDDRLNDKLGAFENYALIGEQCLIEVDNSAINELYQFGVEMVLLMDELKAEGIDALAGRAAEIAGRLAFIAALACDPYARAVEAYHAKVAINYVRKCTLNTIGDVRSNLVNSPFQQAKKEVLAGIRAAKNGVTERDMHRQAPFSKFKDKELVEILQALTKAELVAVINTREGKPGAARNAFVALSDIDLG